MKGYVCVQVCGRKSMHVCVHAVGRYLNFQPNFQIQIERTGVENVCFVHFNLKTHMHKYIHQKLLIKCHSSFALYIFIFLS